MVEPSEPRLNLILIGNPGVGKSTILNGLVENATFKSGLSSGEGLTEVLQEAVDPKTNVRFMDTPGLQDVRRREKAAQEIKKALQKDGLYAVFFVVTLESGRVRMDDKTTIRLVLEAVPNIKHNYSVIVNKVSKPLLEKYEKEPREKAKTITFINEGVAGTSHIFWYDFNLDLMDQEDKAANLTPEFLKFLFSAPTIHIPKAEVQNIKYNEFELMKKELGDQISTLEKNGDLLQKRLADQAEEMKKMREFNEQTQALHKDEIQKVQNSYAKKIQEKQDEIMNITRDKDNSMAMAGVFQVIGKMMESQRDIAIKSAETQATLTKEMMATMKESSANQVAAMKESNTKQMAAMQDLSAKALKAAGGCFAFGSVVFKRTQSPENSQSYRPTAIEEINLGDEVLTCDKKGKICWDIVALVDENKEAQERGVQMIKITLEEMDAEVPPLILTDHHYVFIIDQEGIRQKILAKEVKVGDEMIVFSSFEKETETRKVTSVTTHAAQSPVKNVITAHTRSVLVNSILCSIHCEGDWEGIYFSIGYFLWKYVSKQAPQVMLSIHKQIKYRVPLMNKKEHS